MKVDAQTRCVRHDCMCCSTQQDSVALGVLLTGRDEGDTSCPE